MMTNRQCTHRGRKGPRKSPYGKVPAAIRMPSTHPRRFAEGVHRTAGACRKLPSVGAVLEMEKPGCVHVQSVSIGRLRVPVLATLADSLLSKIGK
jgi:hypothetical protein